jgi:hypothetical protein
MKNKFFLLAASLFLINSSLKAQQLLADVSFGYDQSVFEPSGTSPFDQVNDVWGKLKDSSGNLLTSTNSVAGIGYFTTTPTSFSANSTIFDDFVFLASGAVSAEFSGELDLTASSLDITAADGKKAYLAFFKGITDVSNYASAVELGLVSAMSWDVFSGAAAPSTPIPLSYAIGKSAIDSSNGGAGGVYIGSEKNDQRFGSEDGFNYETAAVPESSTYALLIGSLALLYVLRRR